jgi:hypothetical protein
MSKSSPFRTRLLAHRNSSSRCPLVGENGHLPVARIDYAPVPATHIAALRSASDPAHGCAPRENSRRAQQGHTKCGKARYGPLWPRMATSPNKARASSILLWLRLVGYGLPIAVHTGEVQGSIPCAPTMKGPINKGFSQSTKTPNRQINTERSVKCATRPVDFPWTLFAELFTGAGMQQ